MFEEAPDSDPDEDLDLTPEWRRGRQIIQDELEDAIIKKLPFD